MTTKQLTTEASDELWESVKQGVHTVEVAFRNTKTQQFFTYKKAEISENFSDNCIKALQKIKQNPKPAILVGSIATVTLTAAGTSYHIVKKKIEKQHITNLQNCVKAFDELFKQYFEKIRIGDLDEETVDCLINAIDELLKHKSKFDVNQLNNELRNPISVIPEYTKIFAEANRITLDNYNVLYKSPIETLRYCLVFQKQIFIETT